MTKFDICHQPCCADLRAHYETVLRIVLRDPRQAKPVRMMAFRKIVEMYIPEMAADYLQRDLSHLRVIRHGMPALAKAA